MKTLSFYEVALLGSPLEPLTYSTHEQCFAGQEVEVSLNGKALKGAIVQEVVAPSFQTLPIKDLLPTYFSSNQMALARFMGEYYGCSLGEALDLNTPFSYEISAQEVQSLESPLQINLSPLQSSALAFLSDHEVSLIFGDTGSGKSEIYMKRMETLLGEKKRSLLLLPEIALTPQMEERFKNHFGQRVVVWHSKMTPVQKKKTLLKIYNGEASIIVGPRSALFLPIKDLGLIVVDEEHDESYKSSSRPRYNAKDIAIYKGNQEKIPVILGSATPSLSSYLKYPYFRLKGGFKEGKKEYIFEPSKEQLTPFIDAIIRENHEQAHQGIVFIPTRANFKYLLCEACGESVQCPFCSVGMSVHRNARMLKCHYCNYTEMMPKRCPKCQSERLVHSRLGTAEAVEHFTTELPEIKVHQFDRDVITTQNKLVNVLKAFNDHEIDLLVGTQMLSKGHDYHNVHLAVVFGLDNLLSQADYRAREKALALLIQIAGRSGRAGNAKVVVQTLNEDFFKLYLSDYELFLQEELIRRKGLYPPYKKFARLLFAHKSLQKAQDAMLQAQNQLQMIEGIEIIGYGPSPIEKIANKFRFQIILRSEQSTALIRSIKKVKSPLCEIDMDPIEFT